MMKKILFICTGNASRSQMAEGLVNHDFKGRIEAHSAGTNPKSVSLLAIKVLQEIGIDISGQVSEPLKKYETENFDYVISLCHDADRNCPAFFGGSQRLHMGFPDPPHSNVPSEGTLRIYRELRDEIRRKMQKFFQHC